MLVLEREAELQLVPWAVRGLAAGADPAAASCAQALAPAEEAVLDPEARGRGNT